MPASTIRRKRRTRHDYVIVDGVAVVDVSTTKYPNAVALINVEDIPLIENHVWTPICTTRPGNLLTIYLQRRNGPVKGYLHRHILGLTDINVTVDHINHNGLDNRRANLRHATRATNLGNQRKRARPASSQYKGVTRHRQTGKWQVFVGKDYLGLFANEEEAARAYDDEAVRRWGEYARPNFPE